MESGTERTKNGFSDVKNGFSDVKNGFSDVKNGFLDYTLITAKLIDILKNNRKFMKPFNKILDSLSMTPPKPRQIRKTRKNATVEPKDESVVQHNHLVEARYRLSLQEKRVILWLLTQIKPDDEDFKLHKLEILEFTKMINVEVDNRYSELRNITKRLIQRAIEIYDPQSCEFIQVSWLSAARYQIRKGCVLLEFSPQLKPYLLQLKSQFTKLSIGDMMQLSSIHSTRFYELLKQYESIGQREISIKDLRKYCGINEEEYKRYNDFKKDVLERAKKEINEKTDIAIDYQELKESRKIVATEWTIKKKAFDQEGKLKLTSQHQEFRSKESLIEAITKYGFGRTTARQFIKNYKKEDIKNALRAVDLQIERNHVRNPKAMLKTAIQEQWDPEVFKDRKKHY